MNHLSIMALEPRRSAHGCWVGAVLVLVAAGLCGCTKKSPASPPAPRQAAVVPPVEKTAKTQADLFVESMNANVAAAEAKLRADKSRLEYAETFLGRVQRLVPIGAETEDDLELARLAQVEKEVAYRQDVLTLESQKALQAATLLMPKLLMPWGEPPVSPMRFPPVTQVAPPDLPAST